MTRKLWTIVTGLCLAAVLALATGFLGGAAFGFTKDAGTQTPQTAEVAAVPAGIRVDITATVVAVRALVVDAQGTITGIWSNSPAEGYKIVARQGTIDGAEVEATDQIIAQYLQIKDQVDWTRTGQVYP